MNRIVSIFKSGMAVYFLIFIISCHDSTNDDQVLSPFKIIIPAELKQISEIEKLVTKTETQINHLTEETKFLISEYRHISGCKTKEDNLMMDIKKVTIRGRINTGFENLSEIYNKIDFQTSELANPLNTEQKKALELITNQLKNRIDELMIYYKSFDKENKKRKN